jgi:hypothetical protein
LGRREQRVDLEAPLTHRAPHANSSPTAEMSVIRTPPRASARGSSWRAGHAFAAGLASALGQLGCSMPAELSETDRELRSEVVYADDDRTELHAAEPALRAFGERSVVALIDAAALAGVGSDPRAAFSMPSSGGRRNLCAGVRYAEQPAAASCTGVLVDHDFVMTAGHCARSLACENLSLLFGYYYDDDARERTLSSSDVYACANVVTFEIPSLRETSTTASFGWIARFLRTNTQRSSSVAPPRSKANASAPSASVAAYR